jgi:uncharacterized coiled-coil DUF342 family protein
LSAETKTLRENLRQGRKDLQDLQARLSETQSAETTLQVKIADLVEFGANQRY